MSLTKVSYSMILGAPINVDDYGADPTGITDSSDAIQAALDSGATSIMFTGQYKVSKQLVVTNDYQNLFASGAEAAIITETTVAANALASSAGLGVITVLGSNYVQIRNIHVDQTANTTVGCDSFLFFQSTNGKVLFSRSSNSTGNGIHFYDACNDALIQGNTCYESVYDGILFHARSHRARIVDNLVQNTTVAGIEVEGRIGSGDGDIQRCSDVVISNNVIRNTAQSNEGVLVIFGSNITVANNIFDTVDGVHFIGAINCVVDSNSFVGCWNLFVNDNGTVSSGFTLHDGSSDVVVTNNTFYTADWPASPRWEGFIQLRNISNCLITGNEIYASTGSTLNAVIFCLDTSTVGSDIGTLAVVKINNNTVVTDQGHNPAITVFYGKSTSGNSNPFTGVEITNNRLNVGYQANIFGPTPPAASNSYFVSDLASYSSAVLQNFIFERNTIASCNPIWFYTAGTAAMTNCSVSYNTFKSLSATQGIYFTAGTALTVTYCKFDGNRFYDTGSTPIAIGANVVLGATNTMVGNIAKGSSLNSQTPTQAGNVF